VLFVEYSSQKCSENFGFGNRVFQKHKVLEQPGCHPVPKRTVPGSSSRLRAGHDTLAWVLGYECGQVFADNLRVTEETLKELATSRST
jgi:hypothetical protein